MYNDERIRGALPDFRSKKVKLELTCQSLEQQSTRQAESLSFYLSQRLSLPLYPTHRQHRRPPGELRAEL